MTKLNTLTVHVLNASGKEMFENPRFLRVITSGPEEGKFAVARHGKGLVVTSIVRPDAVAVDSTAARVDLTITRASKLADIGVATAAAATAKPPATPSDLPELIKKYQGTVAKQGREWLKNALSHTKDIVKREAMEIALGIKPAAAPKAKGKKAKDAAPKASGINVAELVQALSENGVDDTAIAQALAKVA